MSGLNPVMYIEQSSINFPPTEINTFSEQSLIIKNNGLSNLYLNNIYSLDNSFSINPTYLNIAQDSQEVLISFLLYQAYHITQN